MAFDSSSPLVRKIPFLFGAVIFFLFSLFLFVISGVTFSSFFNFEQVYNPQLLYSWMTILFTILFAASLSFSVFYGFELSVKQAVFPFLVFLFLSIFSVLFLPNYFPLFIAMAICVGLAPILVAWRGAKPTSDNATFASRVALLFFLVLITAFAAGKTELNKEAYFDDFLNGAGAAPQYIAPLLGGAQLAPGVDASQIASVTLTAEEIKDQLGEVELFQTFHQYFSLFIAVLVFVTASFFTGIVRLINKVFNWLLAKVVKMQKT